MRAECISIAKRDCLRALEDAGIRGHKEIRRGICSGCSPVGDEIARKQEVLLTTIPVATPYDLVFVCDRWNVVRHFTAGVCGYGQILHDVDSCGRSEEHTSELQ